MSNLTYAEKTGELVSVSYNDEATPTETHTYNHLGQLTRTVDASGTSFESIYLLSLSGTSFFESSQDEHCKWIPCRQ